MKAAIADIDYRNSQQDPLPGVKVTDKVIEDTLVFMENLWKKEKPKEFADAFNYGRNIREKLSSGGKTKDLSPELQHDYAVFCTESHKVLAEYHKTQKDHFTRLSKQDTKDKGFYAKCAEVAAKAEKVAKHDAEINQAIANSLEPAQEKRKEVAPAREGDPAYLDVARMMKSTRQVIDEFIDKGSSVGDNISDVKVRELTLESSRLVHNLSGRGLLKKCPASTLEAKETKTRRIYNIDLTNLKGKIVLWPKFDENGHNLRGKDGKQMYDWTKIGNDGKVVDGIILPPKDRSSMPDNLITDLREAHQEKLKQRAQQIGINARKDLTPGQTPPVPDRANKPHIQRNTQ
ncbi:MAG UNVERIFIED_CONTAM: hypothetical protein LVQ98_03025 [Rickettsiaceae bacterium]|jgi:hypothetical protein